MAVVVECVRIAGVDADTLCKVLNRVVVFATIQPS